MVYGQQTTDNGQIYNNKTAPVTIMFSNAAGINIFHPNAMS
jgi:hypothetical protein